MYKFECKRKVEVSCYHDSSTSTNVKFK